MYFSLSRDTSLSLFPSKNKKMIHQDFLVDAYDILGVGCSKVVKAVHQPSKKVYVAKLLELSDRREEMLRVFYNEAQILQVLHGENNIVNLVTSCISANTAIIILERLQGDLLEIILDNEITLNQKMTIFSEICFGVQQCHNNGVAHLDIKPDNILVSTTADSSFIVKLADFGTSQIMDENDTVFNVKGTLHYNAPEVFTQSRTGVDGKKADIWSLGILLHVLLSGTWPVRTNDPEELRELLSKGILHYSPQLTKEQHRFISKLLSLDPKQRPSIEGIISSEFLKPHMPIPIRPKLKSKSFFSSRKSWIMNRLSR